MTIALIVEKNRVRPWLRHFQSRLAQALKTQVVVDLEDEAPLVFPMGQILPLEEKKIAPTRTSDQEADIVIDFTHNGSKRGRSQTLVPLFKNSRGEDALLHHLIEGENPVFSLWQKEQKQIIAKAQASLENSCTIPDMLGAIHTRLVELVIKALLQPISQKLSTLPAATTLRPSPLKILSYTAKCSLHSALHLAYRSFCHAPHWRVGWRFIERDKGIFETGNLSGPTWNVIKDPGDHIYADPFPFHHNGKTYVFFEDMDHKIGRGVISVLELDRQGPIGKVRTVLEEPWHLSYPFLMVWKGEIFMIPEGSESGKVILYRAQNFPDTWEQHSVLLDDIETADVTIIPHEDRLWMFSVTRNGVGGYSDMLDIHYAHDLMGPWIPHALNPVVISPKFARPAGNITRVDGKLIRPVQNCEFGYGLNVSLMEITELTPTRFSQKPLRDLYPGGAVWPGRKLHTINRSQNLEVIDGSILRPKSAFARKIMEKLKKPRAIDTQ